MTWVGGATLCTGVKVADAGSPGRIQTGQNGISVAWNGGTSKTVCTVYVYPSLDFDRMEVLNLPHVIGVGLGNWKGGRISTQGGSH